jgi:hypothetical protein
LKLFSFDLCRRKLWKSFKVGSPLMVSLELLLFNTLSLGNMPLCSKSSIVIHIGKLLLMPIVEFKMSRPNIWHCVAMNLGMYFTLYYTPKNIVWKNRHHHNNPILHMQKFELRWGIKMRGQTQLHYEIHPNNLPRNKQRRISMLGKTWNLTPKIMQIISSWIHAKMNE